MRSAFHVSRSCTFSFLVSHACSLEDPFCDPGLDLDLQRLDLDLQCLIRTPGARFGPPGLDLDSGGLISTPGA